MPKTAVFGLRFRRRWYICRFS